MVAVFGKEIVLTVIVTKRSIEKYSSNQTNNYYNHEKDYADDVGNGDAESYTSRVDKIADMSSRGLYRWCEAWSHRWNRKTTRVKSVQASLWKGQDFKRGTSPRGVG